MNWFKKSSHEHRESQHSEQKHKRIKKTSTNDNLKAAIATETAGTSNRNSSTSTATTSIDDAMTKSLSSLVETEIEVLDPEEFFHDPEHVRLYKEEEVFLNMMSEWEIVQSPATTDDNFFSADFEDELIQRRTQDIASHECHDQAALNDSANSSDSSCLDISGMLIDTSAKSIFADVGNPQFKRTIYEILFADNIQIGIALPQRKIARRKRKLDERTESNTDSNEQSLCKAHATENITITTVTTDIITTTTTNTTTALTPQGKCLRITKDCAINRTQLKTEALASSIMGAIGKCPSMDSSRSPHNSLCELNAASAARNTTCDHYDIKEFFKLDDAGNILINISHIEECKGFGFAVAQNKRLYRRFANNCKCIDDKFCNNRGCCLVLKCLFRLLWELIIGHPRNKINPYGSGPGDSVRAYTLQLAHDQSSTFARNIENFISCTKESREAAPQVVMRNMRQFMNGMKNYLVKHGEGKFHQEVESARSRLKSDEFLNLDAILETVMHQLVVLPLREHLYGMFVDYYTRSEDIQLLAQNVKYACGRNATDFGIRSSVAPPSSTSLQIISSLLLRLQEAELPLDKLDLFLCVISTIFDATGCPRGQQLGADDFLPVLVYVVAKCGFVGAEIEAEFMWGLLQPTLLNGEPGYYLTALCSAVHVLKSFMASENESGSGSLDWRSSSLPACSSVLRVIIPDECNGSLQTRTLPVRPHTTTREVCRIIAHKARITNPQDYALFKLVNGEETLLSDIECPQDIRLAAKGKHCMLAYKRIDAKIAWPTATQ